MARGNGATFNPSEAALFRKIEKDRPAVLWNEIDAVFQGKATDPTQENLRGLVNSGFERNGRVPRCDGAQHKVKDYSVFCLVWRDFRVLGWHTVFLSFTGISFSHHLRGARVLHPSHAR